MMGTKVYIQEAERTKAYKKTDLCLVELLCEPAQKILSRIDPSRIDGVFVSVQNISSSTREGNIATKVADRLGLRGAEAERVETASNGHTALLRAFDAVASGRCKRVLAIGGEKMSAVERDERSRIINEVIDPVDRACGLTMPAAIALISLEYARVNNISETDFAALLEKIALRAYRYAALNPNAQFSGRKISAEEYRDETRNPVFASPLRMFDSCPTSDAAGAIFVTNKETEIEISGVGHAVDGSRLLGRYYIDHLEATRWAARKAYKQAGILNPRELSGLIVEQHDAFGPLFLLNLVDLGIFTHAEAVKAIEKGTLDKDGAIPTNISGGLKDLHALGGTGLIKIIDACKQLLGQAPPEVQVKKPKVAICHSIGGPGNNIAVTVLDKTGNRRYRHHFRRWQPEPLPHNNEPHKPVLPQGILEVSTTVHPRPGQADAAYTIAVVNCAGKRVLAAPADSTVKCVPGDEVKLATVLQGTFNRYVYV
jgi:acetyl-CoA C-acetyltransferase